MYYKYILDVSIYFPQNYMQGLISSTLLMSIIINFGLTPMSEIKNKTWFLIASKFETHFHVLNGYFDISLSF